MAHNTCQCQLKMFWHQSGLHFLLLKLLADGTLMSKHVGVGHVHELCSII